MNVNKKRIGDKYFDEVCVCGHLDGEHLLDKNDDWQECEEVGCVCNQFEER